MNKYPQRTVYPEDIECVFDAAQGRGAIYVGNIEAAENLSTLKGLGICGVLTVTQDTRLNHPRKDIPYYLYIAAEDHERADLSIHFETAADFIAETLKHTNVLVHCMAGVSRSVSLVLAYMMKYQKMGFRQALQAVRRKRRIVNPNRGFIKQLERYERQLGKQAYTFKRSASFARPSKDTASPSMGQRYGSQAKIPYSAQAYLRHEPTLHRSTRHEHSLEQKDLALTASRRNIMPSTPQHYDSPKYTLSADPLLPESKYPQFASISELNKHLDDKIQNIRKKYMEATGIISRGRRAPSPQANENHRSYYLDRERAGLRTHGKSYYEANKQQLRNSRTFDQILPSRNEPILGLYDDNVLRKYPPTLESSFKGMRGSASTNYSRNTLQRTRNYHFNY